MLNSFSAFSIVIKFATLSLNFSCKHPFALSINSGIKLVPCVIEESVTVAMKATKESQLQKGLKGWVQNQFLLGFVIQKLFRSQKRPSATHYAYIRE